MAITKAKKVAIIQKATEALKNAAAVVFVGFNKISVADTSAMRKTLTTEGIGYYVAKKTLLKRALADAGYTGEVPDLPGEVAIAWTAGDPTAPARGIHMHGKKHEGLSILGGIFEGKFLDAVGMKAIATIPSVPVLRGMFVNVVNSPIQGMAVALSQIAEKKGA